MSFEGPIITGVSSIALDALSPGFFSTYTPIQTGVSTGFCSLVGHILYFYLKDNQFEYDIPLALGSGLVATAASYVLSQLDLHQMPVLFIFTAASSLIAEFAIAYFKLRNTPSIIFGTSDVRVNNTPSNTVVS